MSPPNQVTDDRRSAGGARAVTTAREASASVRQHLADCGIRLPVKVTTRRNGGVWVTTVRPDNGYWRDDIVLSWLVGALYDLPGASGRVYPAGGRSGPVQVRWRA